MTLTVSKVVKASGNSGHITLPKKWIGRRVVVEVQETPCCPTCGKPEGDP